MTEVVEKSKRRGMSAKSLNASADHFVNAYINYKLGSLATAVYPLHLKFAAGYNAFEEHYKYIKEKYLDDPNQKESIKKYLKEAFNENFEWAKQNPDQFTEDSLVVKEVKPRPDQEVCADVHKKLEEARDKKKQLMKRHKWLKKASHLCERDRMEIINRLAELDDRIYTLDTILRPIPPMGPPLNQQYFKEKQN